MAEASRSPLGCTTETPSPTSFVKWCNSNKVLWEKCKVSVSDVTGRCVVAKQLIRQGEVVVEVPDSQVLMAENSQISQLLAEDGLLKPAEDALLEVQGLILAVMYEKALGKKSHWQSYLSFLPDDMSHMIMYWTVAELQELRGTTAYDKLIGRVQHPADAPTRMHQLFDELVLPFVQSHESVCKTLLGKNPEKCSEEEARKKLWPLYQWSTAVVASYSFVLGDDQYQGMVPVWDLLNHITGKVNVRLHHDADKEVLQMVATSDIPAGAEVVNCYGQLSNAELLRGYGFVEQHNMIRHVHVPAQFLIRAAAAAADAPAAAAAAEGSNRKRARKSAAADPDGRCKETDADDDHDLNHDHGQLSQDDDDDKTDQEDESSDDDDDADDHDHDDDQDDDESSGDDHSDQGDDESSDEDDEPDWDLEDDSSEDYVTIQQQQQQQQQQQRSSIPRLAAAQDQIADWEDRWQLCHFLKLLPKNNVFQVSAGGVAAVQGNLLAVLLLLLADGQACEKLAAVAVEATSKAAEVTVEAAQKRSKCHKGKKHSKQQQQQQQQQGTAASDPAATVAAEAVSKLEALKFDVGPSLLVSSLKLLLRLMLSRYTCSLEEDYQQQQQQQDQTIAPRLAAAVMARIGEKEVLHQLMKDLQVSDAVADQLMTSARQSLTAALQQIVMTAAAAADSGGKCCGVSGCIHEAKQQQQHSTDHVDNKEVGVQHSGQHDHQQQQAKGRKRCQQQATGIAAAEAADMSNHRRKKKLKGEQEREQQQQQQQQKKMNNKKVNAADSSGFAFNFQM